MVDFRELSDASLEFLLQRADSMLNDFNGRFVFWKSRVQSRLEAGLGLFNSSRDARQLRIDRLNAALVALALLRLWNEYGQLV